MPDEQEAAATAIERDQLDLALDEVVRRARAGKPADDDEQAATPPCADLPLPARLEALLLASERPLSDSRLAQAVGLTGRGAVKIIREALDTLNENYTETGRAFEARQIAGGWQLLTRVEFAPLLEAMHSQRAESRLSPAALETLSIVAYRQPIMRAEIEAIRGVASGEVIRGLLERRLLKIAGRAEQLGRPLLYGTTSQFLKVFGLGSLDDLPPVDDGLPSTPATVEETPNQQPEAEPEAE